MLRSIFRDSIYASLDDPVPTPPPRVRTPPYGQGDDEDDPDPFDNQSPLTRSPAATRIALSTIERGRQISHDGTELSSHALPHMADSRSPFQADPVDAGTKASLSSSSRSPPASPPPKHKFAAQRKGTAASTSGLTGGSSAIGNRSLMGLLGGTRYDGAGFDGLGFGQGLAEESEEEDAVYSGKDADNRRLLSGKSAASSIADEHEEPPDFTSAPSTSPTSGQPHSVRTDSTGEAWAGLRLGGGPTGGILGARSAPRKQGLDGKEKALWKWINIEDFDGFLQEVYMYYVGKGIWAMALSRFLNLLTVGWVIFFSTFLLGCIDYSVLWDSHTLSEIVVDKCTSRFSGLTVVIVASFSAVYFWKVVRFGMGIRQLWEMHEFYAHLLEIPEDDIQTISWHALVQRLTALRASHPSALSHRPMNASQVGAQGAHKLDAHDVANRIMREENYLIALFNKDVLDLSVPVPLAVSRTVPPVVLRALGVAAGSGTLTRTLEWNLSFCLTRFLFGPDGQVRRAFVTDKQRAELVRALRNRFILSGCINLALFPFIFLYLLMYSFFRYFEEYHKNPASIGSRQFTNLARWKFREFNELPHLFQQRLNRAHPVADSYVNQFPKEKTALVSHFVAFFAGSFAAVLVLFSIIDPDAFLHFEITPGRTVLFYLGVFGSILAVARGMVPDENRVVDPEELMRGIIEHTHYLPTEWRGKLHSAEVHTSFSELFQMKIALFFKELVSVAVTPAILCFSLPQCAGQIVDFFREFTVHVDGLGYVCSFAVFDFQRHGDLKFGAPVQVEDDKWKSREGKMEKSLLNFKAHNPEWIPHDQAQSLFLSRVTEVHPAQQRNHSRSRLGAMSTRSASRTNRFNVGHDGEGPLSTQGETSARGRVRPDNTRLYERALQRSVMHSGRLTHANGKAVPVHVGTLQEEPLDEVSMLDGDPYPYDDAGPSDDDYREDDREHTIGTGFKSAMRDVLRT